LRYTNPDCRPSAGTGWTEDGHHDGQKQYQGIFFHIDCLFKVLKL